MSFDRYWLLSYSCEATSICLEVAWLLLGLLWIQVISLSYGFSDYSQYCCQEEICHIFILRAQILQYQLTPLHRGNQHILVTLLSYDQYICSNLTLHVTTNTLILTKLFKQILTYIYGICLLSNLILNIT